MTNLFREERRVRPGESRDLWRGIEAMGMIEEELQQLEFAMGQHSLAPFVTDDAAVRFKPEALELPDPLIPQVEPGVVAGHLRFDESDVLVGGGLGHGMQFGQLALDPIEQAKLEANEVVINAHPVARVFP